MVTAVGAIPTLFITIVVIFTLIIILKEDDIMKIITTIDIISSLLAEQ